MPTRRILLRSTAIIAAGFAAGGAFAQPAGQPPAAIPTPTPSMKQKPPRFEDDVVKRFVAIAHNNLEGVKEMLAERPALVNACWDSGGGDFEVALGGPSHVGRPDIALFLLEHGARMDVFAATMLGKIEILRAYIADNPRIVHLKGPHGLSLLHHADRGGHEETIALVKEYLERTKE